MHLQYNTSAGNDVPTGAFVQVMDRQRIAGSSTITVVHNAVLSPRDLYSYARMKTARIWLFCLVFKISGDILIANLVLISDEDCA